MDAVIHLAKPVPADEHAGRVNYAAGRTLTAGDFKREDDYASFRLRGLAPAIPGVIAGLDVGAIVGATGITRFTIGVGSAIGADGQMLHLNSAIDVSWTDLKTAVGTVEDGLAFLLLRAATFEGLDGGPPSEPVQRASLDPLLDVRRETFVEVWLSPPVAPVPSDLSTAGVALAFNTLVGGLTQSSLGTAIGNGVPVAAVLVRAGQALQLSRAAGRLPTDPALLDAMLLAQTREAVAAARTESDAQPTTSLWQNELRGRFRFLPPAGELPPEMLLHAASAQPSCPFFPSGIVLTLQFIRASQAAHLIGTAAGRPRLDLANLHAEAVNLGLAIPDAAWTRDLIDIPRGDPVLAADLHLAYARARVAQVAWRDAWVGVYGAMQVAPAEQPQIFGFLMASDAAARNLSHLLTVNLPSSTTPALTARDLLDAADGVSKALASEAVASIINWVLARLHTLSVPGLQPPAPVPNPAPRDVAAQLIALGYQVLDPKPPEADPTVSPHAPVESDSVLAPLLQALPDHSGFVDWTTAVRAEPPDPVLLQPLIHAGVLDAIADPVRRRQQIDTLLAMPQRDDTVAGLLLQLALLQLFYAVFVRVTQAHEHRLEAHDRMLALQRQHLDIMSTYVSALAGGVPGDGRALGFARLIPFVDLHASDTQAPTPAAPTPSQPSASPQTPSLTRMTVLNAAAIGPAFSPAASVATTLSPSVLGLATLGPVTSAGAATPNTPMRTTFGASMLAGGALSTRSGSPGVSGLGASGVLQNITTTGTASEAVPVLSGIGQRLGSSGDVARSVATQIGALAQAPPFNFQQVQYGVAAHITQGDTLLRFAQDGMSGLRELITGQLGITPSVSSAPPASAAGDIETQNYAGIIASTRDLLRDISLVEGTARPIETAYLQFRDRLVTLEARIAQITAALGSARDTLRNAQRAAAQANGDYAAAQHLVKEEAARVATATAARTQAIAAATGLFFRRELQTMTLRTSMPAMALIADTPDDLVPGCPSDHPGPPPSLQPFLELLLEVPLADWLPLRDFWVGLPDVAGLQRLGALRAARLTSRIIPAAFGNGAAAGDLAGLAQATHDAFEPVFRSSVPIVASLAASQQAAFTRLALPDIVALPASLLRNRAEMLRARLESAAGCLFETLTALPPSVRFDWAALARARTLPLLSFAQWPLPAGAGDAAAAAVRRLGALVDWMRRQLHADSSAAAQTALGNLIAAAVMAATYGDPDEAITGTVATTGLVPRPGVPIRILLNRPPPIGTVLHLFDERQVMVGTVRVDDHDDAGTVATVVTNFATAAPVGGWTVAGPGSRTAWLPA